MSRGLRVAIVSSFLGLGLFTAVPPARSADASPALLQGEIEGLRAVLDDELAGTDYQRVGVARFLMLAGDTRRARAEVLDSLETSGLEVDDALVDSFRSRNRSRLELWGSKAQLLGQRSERGTFFLENPRHVAVQYARMGSSVSGDRGLVYLELRPHQGAEHVTGVFRVLERTEDGWRVLPGRAGFVRDEFRVKPLED